MSSLIPGYEYDIFISYRQKDNKIDGWITEFVEHLQRELEATLKDDVSVYFDVNPHDGLLETHDVDSSLEEKLKCLIFIPVISRTYCDPRSFAWDHEFRAFVEQASQDRFGLKIKLPNGNFASRVLPVRIHDLNTEDVKLCESIIGGYLRGVDFIYKSAGVNRPLRAHEDHPHDNLNKTFYRDQINKVANAIDEIITSLKKDQFVPPKKATENTDEKLIIQDSGPERKLEKPEKKFKNKWRIRTTAAIAFVLLLCGGILVNHRVRVKWARTTGLSKIEQLSDNFEFQAAFDLVQKTKRYIPDDPRFRSMESMISTKMTFLTDPPGADVYIRSYSTPDEKWRKVGRTPVDSISFPCFTYFQVKFTKEGYDTLLGAMATPFGYSGTKTDSVSRKLFKKGTIPSGMVYVEGYWDEVSNRFIKDCGFFIDRYEVTNRQYKEFIDKGGYRNPAYWKNGFTHEGKKLTLEEALSLFVDKTGRPGPSTWEAGDFPEGQDNFPVSGISWYEAAAYAEFAGKSLPTADHWDSGAGFWFTYFYKYILPQIVPISNFNGKGPVHAGDQNGITPFGALDMAGNVREWCWNETTKGHIIAGGGYDDASYLYTQWSQLPSLDRSAQNGFRCVLYPDKSKIPQTAFRNIDLTGNMIDFNGVKPASDAIFQVYRNQFLYDSIPLNSKVLFQDNKPEDWVMEKISFTATYANESMIAYLYLPKNAAPPYQTVVFFPGSYAQQEKDLPNSKSSNWFIDYIIKSGRAVVYPVYKGTFERNYGKNLTGGDHLYKDLLTQWVKDFSRTVDYLETRPDMDMNKLCYYGHSWGGILGAIIPAVEERLKLSILITGGFSPSRPLPEADQVNYLSHVKIPVLMLNGRYDDIFEINTNVRPFFQLLGSPSKDKRLCVYETGHYVSRGDMIRETLSWLDKYFGPVNQVIK